MRIQMKKLRAPEGMRSISHEGNAIQIEADGSVLVSDGAVEALTSHGFTPFDFNDFAREDLLTRARSIGETQFAKMSDNKLRAMIASFEDSQRRDSERAVEHEADLARANAETTESFEAMDRAELFAFIKARGGAPAPATADATLRKIAASLPASLLTDPAHTEA
jgi:hypothetical protein